MAITTQRVMFLLDRIYRFRAGSPAAPTEVQVESPVQVVHDVSRDSALSSIVTDPGASGFFSLDQDNVHVGGDLVDATVDPYGTLDATWGEPGKRWVWLMQFAASATSTSVFGAGAYARLAASVGALGNAITRRDYLLALWQGASCASIATSLSATFPISLVHSLSTSDFAAKQAGIVLPFPLFPNTVLTWRSAATVAVPGTIRFEALCWIGPFGVYPPGLR